MGPSSPGLDSGGTPNFGVGAVPLWRYVLAVGITVAAVYSQYLVGLNLPALGPTGNFALSLSVVYGVPILAFATLVGVRPVSRYVANPRRATLEGLRWYGLTGLLAIVVTFFLLILYTALAPEALNQLSRPNPVLVAAAHNVAFWIGFSFVIGFLEETIFRGWIFGYWVNRGSPRWGFHAVWTSLLFAFVHLYYGTTYGSAATFALAQLFLGGLGFALAYRASGGNILVIALLHGANDAIAFFTLVSSPGAEALHWILLGVGGIIALLMYLRQRPTAPSTPVGLPPQAVPYYWLPPGAPPAPGAENLPRGEPMASSPPGTPPIP
jgi:membrane protease YdiL (CAAX protease family)